MRWLQWIPLALLASVAQAADTFPSRPLRLIVPVPPGGGADFVARGYAQLLTQSLGQQVVVDNRPGGVFTVGSEIVAKAAPDGYTIGTLLTPHVVNPFVLKNLPYDTERDFTPVSLLVIVPGVMTMHPAVGPTHLKEVIALAKARPGQLNYASPGQLTSGHLSMEMLKLQAGIDITHIPYKGGAPAIADLISGQVQLMFESTNSIAPHVRNGRVRALAVTGTKRSISLPEVPTLIEAGVAGYEVNAWSGVIAPAGLPRPILERLNKAINAAILVPETKERFEQLGSEGGGGTPEQFAELIRRDSAKWADVVKRSGARID